MISCFMAVKFILIHGIYLNTKNNWLKVKLIRNNNNNNKEKKRKKVEENEIIIIIVYKIWERKLLGSCI